MKINRIIQISLDMEEYIKDFSGNWYAYTDCAYTLLDPDDYEDLIKELDKIVEDNYND